MRRLCVCCYVVFTFSEIVIVGGMCEESGPSPIQSAACKVVAGGLASIVTQPADVVKTQMQIHRNKFQNVFQATKYVYKVRKCVN